MSGPIANGCFDITEPTESELHKRLWSNAFRSNGLAEAFQLVGRGDSCVTGVHSSMDAQGQQANAVSEPGSVAPGVHATIEGFDSSRVNDAVAVDRIGAAAVPDTTAETTYRNAHPRLSIWAACPSVATTVAALRLFCTPLITAMRLLTFLAVLSGGRSVTRMPRQTPIPT